jgi:hypothetical protein
MKLSQRDYLTILNYYDIEPPKNNKGNLDRKQIKQTAEDILATKLCRCIKKIDPNNESKSIGICTKSIFTNRSLKYNAFKCSPSFKLIKTRKQGRTIHKTQKKIKFN